MDGASLVSRFCDVDDTPSLGDKTRKRRPDGCRIIDLAVSPDLGDLSRKDSRRLEHGPPPTPKRAKTEFHVAPPTSVVSKDISIFPEDGETQRGPIMDIPHIAGLLRFSTPDTLRTQTPFSQYEERPPFFHTTQPGPITGAFCRSIEECGRDGEFADKSTTGIKNQALLLLEDLAHRPTTTGDARGGIL